LSHGHAHRSDVRERVADTVLQVALADTLIGREIGWTVTKLQSGSGDAFPLRLCERAGVPR
jgi:hypothetical protein